MSTDQVLANRYVAVWNEPDAERRRTAIAELWVPEGEHYVGTREVRGYPALEERVIGSHVKWVAEAHCLFRAMPNAQRLQGVLTFGWEMLGEGGEVRSAGLEFLKLDASDRILVDYQFLVMATR
jgi:hypothetical protein